MADNTLKTRLLSAYNTTAFWSTCTIVPLSGEVCYGVDDNNKILEIKIGNGVDTYAQLPAQSFDNEDHLYQLATPISTAANASNFTATTYLKVNDGLGGSSYSNSSSAVLTIPAATTTKAGAESATDKKIINAAADTRLTGGTTGSTAADNAYVTVNTKTVGSDGSTSAGTSNLKVNGLGSMAFKSSADFVSAVTTAAYNTVGVTIKQTKNGSASTVANFGSAVKSNITTAISLSSAPSSSSTDLPTDYAVWKAIDDLPEPMIFKGSVGTASATISTLPTPSASNEGWTYKAITTGTSAVYHDLDGGETAADVKVGDSLISNGIKWVRIPSGDEPSGTVTSVGVSSTATDSPLSVTGSPITSSGTIDIEHAAGNTTTAKYGATAAKSGIGGTVNVPFIQADKYGHVTSAGHYKFTAPTEAQIKAVKVNNASSADFATSAGDAAKLNGVDASNFLQADDISAGTGITVTTAAGAATVSANLATTAVEGITKKPSGTAPIAVSDDNVISHNNSGVTAGTYGDSTHVSKVTVDAKGHVTSATTVAIPSATSAAEGLTKKPTGTAPISVSADNVISHDNSGVTAGTYGAAQTASFASNVTIPSIKVDAKGHVTTAGTVNVKMPSTAGLGTSAKDIASVTFKANTSGSNNDFGIIIALNDGTNVTTASSIITSTIVLDGNFTS